MYMYETPEIIEFDVCEETVQSIIIDSAGCKCATGKLTHT